MVEPQAAPTPCLLFVRVQALLPPTADPDMDSPSGSLAPAHRSRSGRAPVSLADHCLEGWGPCPSGAQSPNQMTLGLRHGPGLLAPNLHLLSWGPSQGAKECVQAVTRAAKRPPHYHLSVGFWLRPGSRAPPVPVCRFLSSVSECRPPGWRPV